MARLTRFRPMGYRSVYGGRREEPLDAGRRLDGVASERRHPVEAPTQWAITGSPSDGARARFGIRKAASTAPATKIPAPHARVAV